MSYIEGLSPRGRGNRMRNGLQSVTHRSIPAWAGEPTCDTMTGAWRWVYPRVGGGTYVNGHSPWKPEGLSPRGRGNRQPRTQDADGSRSIPAWAGEPSVALSTCGVPTVYPRVGGGTESSPSDSPHRTGLSPRGRGNRRPRIAGYLMCRSIPAWAGEPPQEVPMKCIRWVYPRVGGGTTYRASFMPNPDGLSPRGRGNRADRRQPCTAGRSIPAWAGEPYLAAVAVCAAEVYPRVGGGTWDPPPSAL